MEVPVAVFVLVDVPVALDVLVADAEALNVPEAVSEPDIDCVLLLVAVALPVAVDVDVAVALEVELDVAVAVAVEIATSTPVLTSTSQRYVVAVNDTEINDSMSPASANTAVVPKSAFRPFAAVTVALPPPSVRSRTMKRMPALVGFASVRVSPDAPVVISQIFKSALARIVPASPGSAMSFGPL